MDKKAPAGNGEKAGWEAPAEEKVEPEKRKRIVKIGAIVIVVLIGLFVIFSFSLEELRGLIARILVRLEALENR